MDASVSFEFQAANEAGARSVGGLACSTRMFVM
jgi:hypothetical protein